MSEAIFYEDRFIRITNARAVFGSQTYVMANITSVSKRVMPPNRMLGMVTTFIGLIVIAIAIIDAALYGEIGSSGGMIGGIIALGLFGLVVTIVGIALMRIAKPTYVVRIGSASGESNVLTSKDAAYIQKIVDSMNAAIIKRG
jgi:hypothetical protein